MDVKYLILGLLLLLPISYAATQTFYIPFGFADYYTHFISGSGTTTFSNTPTINAQVNNAVANQIIDIGYGLIDVSSLSGETINSATLYITEHDYTYAGRPAPSQIYTIQIFNGVTYIPLTYGTGITYTGDGTVVGVALTPTEIGYLSMSGYSLFRVTVPDPGGSSARSFKYYAYETSQAQAMRITIDYGTTTTTTTTTTSTTTTTTELCYCGGEYCPSVGNWVVSSPTSCQYENIPVNGSLSVTDSLNLTNVNITTTRLSWVGTFRYFLSRINIG